MAKYDDLTSLEGLDAVRKRPGMYIGSTNSLDGKNPRGLLQLAQEVISNSTDEAMNGYGKNISLTIHEDNSMTISDEGRGIPMGGEDMDAVIRGFTVLHTSGKYGDSNAAYGKSGGLNGVGNKAVTALSEYVTCSAVTSTGDAYEITFNQEKVVNKKYRKRKRGEATGTTITFLPDLTIFDTIDWELSELQRRMENQSYLAPGVTYTLTDERLVAPEEEEEREKFTNTFSYLNENGMADLAAEHAKGNGTVGMTAPLHFHGYYEFNNGKPVGALDDPSAVSPGNEIIDVEIGMIYTDDIGENIITFANGIPTYKGGPHRDGAIDSINKIINDFAVDRKLVKGRSAKTKMAKDDTSDGLILALSVGIPESLVDYEGQMKEQLGTGQAKIAVESTMERCFGPWLYDNEKKGKEIVEKISEAKDAREAARAAREDARAARKTGGKSRVAELSKKLKPALSKDPKERELFIVEGDSAGGSAVQGRNAQTQGILPLKGKPKNIYGKKLSEILANEEIRTIVNVLNAGVGKDFNHEEMEYDKVIIMTDADDDGKHINELLILIFHKLFPGLIENGHLYMANAPLFRFDKYIGGKRDKHFALNVAEFEQMKDQYTGYNVTRMKGLGEMNADDLKLTTMNPGTRVLTQLRADDQKSVSEMLTLFLGDKKIGSQTAAEARYEWIKENVDFRTSDQEIPA